jgi:hypothetical protein
MKKATISIIIIIFIGLIIIAGFLLFNYLNYSGVFFNPGNRYDSSKLNYMGIIYENESDINSWNEGFSTTENCPWGFKHDGLDYFFNNNSNVIAAAPGQVWDITKNHFPDNDGNTWMLGVNIRFNKSVIVGYNFEPWTTKEDDIDIQISMLNVSIGDWVYKGQIISKFLNLNESAHIHFDVRENNQKDCPSKYFDIIDYTNLMNLIHSYHPNWSLCYT